MVMVKVMVKDLEELELEEEVEEVRQLLLWWWWWVRCHSTLEDRGAMLDKQTNHQ